jgi:hypothetical protein
MVITKARKYEEIKAQLKKNEKVLVMSCNSCVRFTGTGGEEKMLQLAQKLKNDGFQIIGTALIGAACIKEMFREKAKADVIVMISCDAGIYNVENELKPKKIVKALETLGIGVRDMKGNHTLVRKFN